MYFNYVDFCSQNKMIPVNAASLGKIIRQVFPSLTSRRLGDRNIFKFNRKIAQCSCLQIMFYIICFAGTRGQSRYHYYGLALKSSSPYYNQSPSRQVLYDDRLYFQLSQIHEIHLILVVDVDSNIVDESREQRIIPCY